MLTAEEVLREQVMLAERLIHPDHATVGYVKSFASDKASKSADISTTDVRMMFYPFDAVQDAGAKAFAENLGRCLQLAQAYQVTERMVDLAGVLYRESQGRTQHLDERELPSDYGFMWLDKTPEQRDRHGRKVATNVITWSKVAALLDLGGSEPEVRPGVRLTFWTSWDVLEGLDEYTDSFYEDLMLKSGETRDEIRHGLLREFGNLTFAHTLVIPFGVQFGITEPGFGDSSLALVHVLWMLMDMEFVTSRHEAALPRAAKRRALRSLKHGTVNVILLRRSKVLHGEQEPAPGSVSWTCRWIVQGHWRNYRDGKRTWIRPYIKGPDGLPIKDTQQLWRLAR